MCDSPRPRPPVLNRSRRLLLDTLPLLIRLDPGHRATLAVADYLAEVLGMDARPDGRPAPNATGDGPVDASHRDDERRRAARQDVPNSPAGLAAWEQGSIPKVDRTL